MTDATKPVLAQPVINQPGVVGAAGVIKAQPATPVQANNAPIDPPKVVDAKLASEPEKPKGALTAYDRIPANWIISPTSVDGVIYARNGTTGKEFTGSPKEFSKYLRSE